MLFRLVRFVALALAGLTLASAAHAQAPEKRDIKFSLGWLFQATQSMFTYGVEKGMFSAEGLNVTVDRGAGSVAAIQRVASGAYDLSYADLGSLAKYNAENPGKELIGVYVAEDGFPLAVFALEGKGITKPKDLEGRRIGAPSFDGARQMFPLFSKANNLDNGKITWLTMDAQLREQMLVRGDVDAITGFTTSSAIGLQGLNAKFVTLRYDNHGVDGFGNTVITSRDFMEKNPNTLRAFLRAFNRSLKGTIENPREALASLKNRDALIDMDVEQRRLDMMVTQVILTPNVVKNGLSSADPKRLQKTIDSVLEVYNLRGPLPAERIYTDRFLPAAAERVAPVYKRVGQ